MANVNKVRVLPGKLEFTNALTGEVENRTVVFSVRSLKVLEEEVGSIEKFLKKFDQNSKTQPTLDDMFKFVYAGLQHYKDVESVDDIENMICFGEVQDVIGVVMEQFAKSMPENVQESKN